MRYHFSASILSLLFVSLCITLFAQPSVQVADKQFENGDFERAALNYIDELRESPENFDAKNRIAACYSHMNKPQKAVEIYEEMIVNDQMMPKDEFLFADNLKKLGDYDRAKKWFMRYADYNESLGLHYAESCAEAKKLENSLEAYLIFPINLNGKTNEFGPCISPFGLVFNTMENDVNDRCAYHLLTAEGEEANFEQPKLLNDRFEERSDVVFVDFSPSGEKVLYTKITDRSCFNGIIATNGMSVYEADVNADGSWENDRALPFNALGYSTAYATYGKTDDEVFYCTDQPSGFGGFDLYRSKRMEERKWSTSQNMGPTVNSAGDEIAPQWNGKSLTFASNWHAGLGGYDIFYCHYNDNKFEKAVNPGRPINSNMDDWNMVFVDQESGYFTTNRNINKSGTDIYYFSALEDNAIAQPIFASEKVTMQNMETAESVVSIAFPLDWDDKKMNSVQNTDPENVKTVYTIQVAVLDKKAPNFEPIMQRLNGIDAIYKVYYDQVVKVRVGSYENEEKAEKVLDQVKSRGYQDAFIVKEKMVIPTQKGEKEQAEFPKAYAEGQYKVRLATYMHPEYFQKEKVESLGEVYKIEKSPYTIFLIGHFDDLFEARKILESAKAKGFTNAQIVTQEDDSLHRIE